MNLSFSPPVKVIAAFGAILVVVAGGGSMLLGRGGSGSATQSSVRHTHVAVHKTTTASGATKTAATKTTTKTSAHGKTTVHKHVSVTTSPTGKKTATKTVTVTHTHKHVHRHKALPSGNLVSSDLPAPLQWQLARHHIVVVSLYDPQSDVDSISVAEAHAGATEAGAGFLLVNVLDDSLAGPLTALLPGGGLLPDPGVLIYRAPGTVAYRLNGFTDRDAVAQAVANAYAGQNGTTMTASSSSSTTVAAAAP